jgi:hypothetical protein
MNMAIFGMPHFAALKMWVKALSPKYLTGSGVNLSPYQPFTPTADCHVSFSRCSPIASFENCSGGGVNAAKALPQDEIEQLAFGEKEGLSMQACVCGVR